MSASAERYSRQVRFRGIGEEGQRRLQASVVAIVGCGALGTVSAEMLARAGIGRLVLIDRDFVEWSNLQRQFLFEESDAADALPKAIAAARRLERVNSSIRIDPAVTDLVPSNIHELLDPVDLIVDGTDNFETRYLLNDYTVERSVPWIYGGAVGSYGIELAIVPQRTACLRCVYPSPPAGAQETCETAGILNPASATIAALQAADAIKILVCGADLLTPRLTTLDLWSGQIRQLSAPARDPECPACVRREFAHLTGAGRAPISLCGRNAVQIHERARPLDLASLAVRLSAIGPVRANEFALRFHVDRFELTVFPDGRAIIKGTTDTGVARSLYARYVGS
jgi:adenylyltransferase/sulfurtransferase